MLFSARSDHLVLGQTGPFSFFPRCRIPLKERAAHTYVAGITGQGKSKLLEHMLFQDITQGRGCGLLDPHSDLASDTLRYLASWYDQSYVVAFFHDRYDRWGREAPLMRESTLNKVAAFTFNPQLRFILGDKENVLDFRRIMDEQEVLIVGLGRCDPETRRLLGSLILTGLELAALSRKDVARTEDRLPFYFYVDEF